MNVMLLSGRPYSVDIALLRSVSLMEAMVVVDWLVLSMHNMVSFWAVGGVVLAV